jgi:Asp-tRNA(Asn)/Glu-tRNA(Gln) amidotransferase B subunit
MEPDSEEIWTAPYRCPWTGKQNFTFAPDFSGLDPDTGELWSPRKVVQLMGLKVADNSIVQAACQSVIDKNADMATSYRNGKKNLIGHFIKLVLEETNKQADPKSAKQILESLLG